MKAQPIKDVSETQFISKRELILGAGNSLKKWLRRADEEDVFVSPFRIDIDKRSNPDLLWDLNERPLPLDDESFDEIHAYEVLEHLGKQGDWKSFFDEWNEYYRLLKKGGLFCASVPSINSKWLWGDPGHTRVISVETLTFLSQSEYEKQVGNGPMTDYRSWYHGNFRLRYDNDDGSQFWFVLEKI